MHTDEYEISIGREITLCRKVIERLRKALRERELQGGMSTEALCSSVELGQVEAKNPDFRSWLEDHRELQSWERKLREYEAALETLKGI